MPKAEDPLPLPNQPRVRKSSEGSNINVMIRTSRGEGVIYIFVFSDRENVWTNRLSMPTAEDPLPLPHQPRVRKSCEGSNINVLSRTSRGGGVIYIFIFSDRENVWDNRLSMPIAEASPPSASNQPAPSRSPLPNQPTSSPTPSLRF